MPGGDSGFFLGKPITNKGNIENKWKKIIFFNGNKGIFRELENNKKGVENS